MVLRSSVVYQDFKHGLSFIKLPKLFSNPFGVYIGMDPESVVTTIDKTDSNKQAMDFEITYKVDSPGDLLVISTGSKPCCGLLIINTTSFNSNF